MEYDDAQRANPIHLLLYQFEGNSMNIEFSFIAIEFDELIIWNSVIDPSSSLLEEVPETVLQQRSPCVVVPKTQLLLTVII